MKDLQTKANINSLLFSFIYVGLGTISVLCSYPPYYGDWVLFALLITFPVSIIGFAIMIAGKYYLVAFIIQLIMFIIVWFIVAKFLLKKYNRQDKEQ